MSLPKNILAEHPFLENDSIIVGYVGSISHGTYSPNTMPHSIDDKDVMAVIVPDIEHFLGLRQFGSRGTKIIKYNKHLGSSEWDIVAYEIRKFVRLLAKGNPNVLCMLWLDETDYMKRTAAGRVLIDSREMFATKQVYHSFIGYARGQLHRMTHMAFEGYMGEKRKTLVEKFGFDVKNASHLIRLLRMGIEFLTEGELYVKRKDSAELLEIKRGEWSLEKVKKEASRLFQLTDEAYVNSPLPNDVNMDAVNELCVGVVRTHRGEQ